jgi:4-hydroxybenzoate polyprenyltransferase
VAAFRARVFDADMDVGLTVGAALFLTAFTLRAGANGNAIPGYLLSLIAGVYAIYAVQDDDPRNQIFFAWAVCSSGILSAYVGSRIKRTMG